MSSATHSVNIGKRWPSLGTWLAVGLAVAIVAALIFAVVQRPEPVVPEHGATKFVETPTGAFAEVAADGLPMVAAREPGQAASFEQLVANSADVLVGTVESVRKTGEEGYPAPALHFFASTVVTDAGERVTIELDSVQTPFVADSWPASGSEIVAFVVPHHLDPAKHRLVSSQGLYLVEGGALSATVSDPVAAELDGRPVAEVMAAVAATQAAIDAGELSFPEVSDAPLFVGPGNGDDPAEEAARHRADTAGATVEN